ncbi:Cytochrome P450 monooxygenase 1 [Colletotrichum sp. SAR 10_70]|nr:Cytochrome P450 monooxygenase 1 [Colletotrichum sp. SAR 10_71]KAI8178258.1 Cytochrome P450 monooxygenase 1 [Colletotrichum sp. SAR 10_70]KAI8188889.1 Cytochrome P450 monooxygenase 1 [Colletotrichum sp. SAR 10_75]KAI8209116.1 Cytochrome P450 monooxygenase 1 [Colletotrichum sp. SAR 10_65]
MLKAADLTGALAEHYVPILKIILVTAVLWQLLQAGYNVFFHPLRDYPGPLLQRASSLPWAFQNAIGKQAFLTQKLHDRYGPVVRISPNHLSFTQPDAWKEIYGFQPSSKGSTEMNKSKIFSETVEELPKSIINADREEHQRLRRALAHGFSDASMREQEGMIIKYIDKLSDRLKEFADDGTSPQNMAGWYNWTTFDVAGDLIFGQSFQCLERADYHPWVAFIFGAIRFGSVMTSVKYIGLNFVVQALFKMGGMKAMSQVRENTDEMMQNRMSMTDDRNDLFEGLLKRRKEWNLSFDQLSANALILVLAGSETTATTLSGTTYLLLTHPEVYEKLKKEVRSAFKDSSEINIGSVSKLSYIPDNWPDPWKFDPERFLESEKTNVNRLDSLQAFSVGPRNCIGRNLAYSEMRMVLARVIFDFDMALAPGNGDWIKRQRAYGLWDRVPLNVYLKPVAH